MSITFQNKTDSILWTLDKLLITFQERQYLFAAQCIWLLAASPHKYLQLVASQKQSLLMKRFLQCLMTLDDRQWRANTSYVPKISIKPILYDVLWKEGLFLYHKQRSNLKPRGSDLQSWSKLKLLGNNLSVKSRIRCIANIVWHPY